MNRLSRHGFTLLELVVAIALIGLLMALILPAVQYTRELARQTQCRNNLRQLGFALSGYESTFNRFPPGRDAQNRWQHSWSTAVLPYLDQSELLQQYRYDRAWDDEVNDSVVKTDLAVFCCPSASESWPGKTDYGGNSGSALTGLVPGFQIGFAWEAGLFPPINVSLPGNYRKQSVQMGEIRDGTSQTFLVLEDSDRPAEAGGMWASGYNCFAHDNVAINRDVLNAIYSRHSAGANVLLGDGSVRMLSESMDCRVIGGLSTRMNGEVATY